MAQRRPWEVGDGLWEVIEPLLPRVERRFRHPGRKRLDDRKALCGILFVLYTGIPWEFLPHELGYGSGMTCWRRLRDWHQAGVWQRLHEVLLAIARRGTAHGSGLGTYRWGVEQAIALLHWFRRLRIRWEIRDDIHKAFLTIGCATCHGPDHKPGTPRALVPGERPRRGAGPRQAPPITMPNGCRGDQPLSLRAAERVSRSGSAMRHLPVAASSHGARIALRGNRPSRARARRARWVPVSSGRAG